MKQNAVGTFISDPDEAFGNPVLPMGANGAKSELLLLFLASFLEKVGRVDAIIGADALNMDIVLRGPIFKLGF